MENPKICDKCGASNLQDGRVFAGPLFAYFLPQQPFRFFQKSVRLTATLCLDCGAVEMSAAPDSLGAYRNKSGV